MLIVRGDDISNDVITLGAYYYLFFNVCVHSRSFRFALIGGNLTVRSSGSHRGIGGRIQIPET